MENEILDILKQMQKDQQEMKVDIKSINGRLERIESDIKDIKLDTNSIKINIKETREDARNSN